MKIPQGLERHAAAELGLLRCILSARDCKPEMLGKFSRDTPTASLRMNYGITDDMFCIPAYGRFFKMLAKMEEDGMRIQDDHALAMYMTDFAGGKLYGSGDSALTHDDMVNLLTGEFAYHVHYYAGQVVRFWKQRWLIEHSDMMAEADHRDPDAIIQEIIREAETWAALNGVGEDAGDEMEKILIGDTVGKQFKTGISGIDKYLDGGIGRKEVMVIAGVPGSGKTTLAMNIADEVSKEGAVLIFSTEMSSRELLERQLVCYSGVPMDRVRNPAIRISGEASKLVTAKGVIEGFSQKIVSGALDISDIESHTRSFCTGNEVSLIVVDYIQKVNNKLANGDVERISSVSARLKDLAMRYDVAVIGLAQLNRTVGDEKPKMRHLKGSSQIEQDASQILFLYCTEQDRMGNEPTIPVQGIFDKNRRGSIGDVELEFCRADYMFRDFQVAVQFNPDAYEYPGLR